MATSIKKCVPVRLIFSLLFMLTLAVATPSQSLLGSQEQQKADATPGESAKVNSPGFTEYRGVRIGMTATEVREKLGKPKLKDKAQDLFAFTENESAQIFYDEQGNVYAVSIDFTGRNDAPTAREVLNEDATARADGSLYGMKRYADAGYWVSYNRTNSIPPQVTITMQKLPQ